MKTILPATFFFGNVPSITSAAEITFDVSERSGEKFRSIDFASSVGTKRSPICTPSGRTMNWLGSMPRYIITASDRERRHELAVVLRGHHERTGSG